MNLGKGIKAVLKEKRISQKELAEKTNLSETSISLIIKGHTQPRKETLDLISEKLDVKPEVISLLSIDREDVPQERKEYYDLLWKGIESNILALFTK